MAHWISKEIALMLFVSLSTPAIALPPGWIYENVYVKRCEPGHLPLPVYIDGRPSGNFYWNGAQISWSTFERYLNDTIQDSDKRTPLVFHIEGDFPRRAEVVSRLKQKGFEQRRCPFPAPIP